MQNVANCGDFYRLTRKSSVSAVPTSPCACRCKLMSSMVTLPAINPFRTASLKTDVSSLSVTDRARLRTDNRVAETKKRGFLNFCFFSACSRCLLSRSLFGTCMGEVGDRLMLISTPTGYVTKNPVDIQMVPYLLLFRV